MYDNTTNQTIDFNGEISNQDAINGSPAEILYWSHGYANPPLNQNTHSHCYWQLEIIVKTNVKLIIEEKTIILTPFCALVIPPEIPHRFEYSSALRESWSFKFNLKNFPEKCPFKIIERGTTSCELCCLMTEKISKIKVGGQSIEGLVKYLLPPIINSCYSLTEKITPNNTLATTIKEEIIKKNGARIAITDLAKNMGYTRGHLSYMFHKKTGTPLKSYIDQERANIAKHLLAYSDYNISELAEIMKFPDVYNFSRFFKRTTNHTPSSYRNQHIQR